MSPARNPPDPRDIEWILHRDGVEQQRLPFEEGVSPVFDVDSRGRHAHYRISLSLGTGPPPHPWLRITAEFLREPGPREASGG